VEDQYTELGHAIAAFVAGQLQGIPQQLSGRQYKAAYGAIQQVRTLAALTNDHTLLTQVDEHVTLIVWQWAAFLLDQPGTPDMAERVSTLFSEAAQALLRQDDPVGAQVLRLLATRYRELPLQERFTSAQTDDLLQRTQAYLTLVKPLHLEADAYIYVRRWLDEAFHHLPHYPMLYYRWAILAQELTARSDYQSLDEHLWELENYLALHAAQARQPNEEREIKRFQAFIAAYNETPAQASILWEELGELELAITNARAAGDLERAYTLLRQTKASIPEELAVAVKALRLLQQLEQKYQGLLPAERQTLLAELTKVSQAVAQADEAVESTLS
jgi:hypothetical protein